MKEKREHPTLTMKVKAPIDVLVAPLVRALSRYPEVMTMYSCQGEPLTNAQKWNFQTDAAFVIFSIGTGSTLELASFLDFMSDHVHLLDCHARTSISMPTG
nr:hypothetical protein [Anaerolineae bacterium]NIQ77233.1 hypothetical protein [Anaerolineae bacterium]